MKVFLSYRRADSRYIADRIYERLTARFGKDEVFKDIDSIPLGIDFRQVLQASVSQCDVLLAVIGPNWAGDSDASGRRRIDSDSDFVRVELEGALQRGIPVVPVLVDGAKMPSAAELPPGLQDLAYRNGTVVRPDPDFDWDMERLTRALEQHGRSPSAKPSQQPAPKPTTKPTARANVVALTIMGAKGGVGKSTIACRMAEMMAEKGQNILLIDLDTGTAGLTTTIRNRVDVPGGLRTNSGRGASVYELLTTIAETGNIAPETAVGVEVTPRYLAETPDRCGRVFLVPAVSGAVALGEATSTLLQRIAARRTRHGAASGSILMSILKIAVARLPKIKCVIIDCGAEGSEFNQMVTEAHTLASASYVVAEPTEVCQASIHRIRHLLAREPGSAGADKVRVIVNRIISSLDEATAAARFPGFRIAGFIPEDHRLFEDLQTGRVNHRYGYDSVSRAIHGILKNDTSLPPALVPDESGWVRPLARAVVELDPLGREAHTAGKWRLWQWAVGSIVAVVCFAGAVMRILQSRGSVTDEAVQQAQGSALLLVLIGLGLLGWVGYQWNAWRPRSRLARQIREIVRSSPQPNEDIVQLLIQLQGSGRDGFALFAWLQDVIRSQKTQASETSP